MTHQWPDDHVKAFEIARAGAPEDHEAEVQKRVDDAVAAFKLSLAEARGCGRCPWIDWATGKPADPQPIAMPPADDVLDILRGLKTVVGGQVVPVSPQQADPRATQSDS